MPIKACLFEKALPAVLTTKRRQARACAFNSIEMLQLVGDAFNGMAIKIITS